MLLYYSVTECMCKMENLAVNWTEIMAEEFVKTFFFLQNSFSFAFSFLQMRTH